MLSLLVALAFILPSAAVWGAMNEKAQQASVNTGVDTGISINNLGAQGNPSSVYIQTMNDPVLGGPNGHSITGGCYNITVQLMNEIGNGPASVKAFVDIYKKSPGTQVVLYETSFEDNFDIYNNWVQIDADCGLIGGQYDSWTWTSARAYCDTHSMKNTMYDVYKGNQDDYLQCTKSFDVSKQDGVSIQFMCWVAGDWDAAYGISNYYVAPMDYLNFEIGDNGGNWVNPYAAGQKTFVDFNTPTIALPGSYYFFDTTWDLYNTRYPTDYTKYVVNMGDGWWKVFFNSSVSDLQRNYNLNTQDLMFRFSWSSDPEYQYEGAYVDCVKVISIENQETKVFQSHSQGPFTIPEGCSNYTFPMEWCADAGDKNNSYDIDLWLEAVDTAHVSLTDWNTRLDIPVFVTDWFDVEVNRIQIESSLNPGIILDTGDVPNVIPDTDVQMTYNDNAHIMTTIHADGTLPTGSIPVTAAAYAKSWKDISFCDFEGTNAYTQLYGEAHVTTAAAYSGTHSLGFMTDSIDRYLPSDTFSYAIGPNIDFSNHAQIYAEYYWKGLTETTATDFACPIIMDNHHNTLLGTGYATTTGQKMGGYQPDWIGPQQPSCRYQRVDLTAYWNHYYPLGYLRDSAGNPLYKSNFGIAWSADGDMLNYNAQASAQGILWSGVFVDDIRVFKEVIADTPTWTQTVVIPGPLEPCQTANVQFNWNNLPYSNYEIVITANAQGACGNMKHNSMSTQIHVYSDLDRASAKDIETIDYTAINAGAWGISTSDTDNYLASNADGHFYPNNANMVLHLCPAFLPEDPVTDKKCIPTTGLTHMYMYFDAWYELEAASDYFYIEVAKCGANSFDDWYPLTIHWPASVGGFTAGSISGSSSWDGATNADDWWFKQSDGTGLYVDLLQYAAMVGSPIEVRIHFTSDSGYQMRGIKLDNINIPALFVDPTHSFTDPCDNLDNWCPQAPWSYGTFWTNTGTQWCWTQPIANPYSDAIIWSTHVSSAYMAEFCFTYTNALTKGQVAAEISTDGGATWLRICTFNTTYRLGAGSYCYDLTPFVNKDIQIRFIAEANPYRYSSSAPYYVTTVSGTFCVNGMNIDGKQDRLAPKTTVTESGTMKASGWYTTPVKVVITATDQGGAGMGEIHYKLDGVEKVVAGSTATFTVSGNGQHTLEFWGVDAVGNVETPHNIAPAFKIDSGAKPTISITAPTPGIYLFGKKIMSSSNIVIIGGFTVTATASDVDSGVYRVSFYLDGNFVADDTTAPYSVYISQKHSGAATLKAVAEDYAQNTADASLTLKYYKFF